MLHFDEKGGKSREIPVRHDLEQIIFDYLDAAGLRNARRDTPLFRTAYKKTGQLTKNALHVIDICRMVKRRLKDAGLSGVLSPHSFHVTTITDLLEQGVPLEDVQRPAGHADPRTTRLYDRRQKKITRNIVGEFRFEASPSYTDLQAPRCASCLRYNYQPAHRREFPDAAPRQ
jgi:site-specific recombinase XerD